MPRFSLTMPLIFCSAGADHWSNEDQHLYGLYCLRWATAVWENSDESSPFYANLLTMFKRVIDHAPERKRCWRASACSEIGKPQSHCLCFGVPHTRRRHQVERIDTEGVVLPRTRWRGSGGDVVLWRRAFPVLSRVKITLPSEPMQLGN